LSASLPPVYRLVNREREQSKINLQANNIQGYDEVVETHAISLH
jgi:hypothetical protein